MLKRVLLLPHLFEYAVYAKSHKMIYLVMGYTGIYRLIFGCLNICGVRFFSRGVRALVFISITASRLAGLWYFWVLLLWGYILGYCSVSLRFKSKYFFIERQRPNCFIWWLGYSHVICIYNPCVYFYFINKRTIIFYSRNVLYLRALLRFYRGLKPLDCYTMRGLRFSQDKLYKRLGKIKRYL